MGAVKVSSTHRLQPPLSSKARVASRRRPRKLTRVSGNPPPPLAAVGDVVEHWQTVFRATHLALGEVLRPGHVYLLASSSDFSDPSSFAASLQAKTHPTSAEDPTPVLPPNALPDRLVRIPVQEPELPGQQGAATQGQLDTAE